VRYCTRGASWNINHRILLKCLDCIVTEYRWMSPQSEMDKHDVWDEQPKHVLLFTGKSCLVMVRSDGGFEVRQLICCSCDLC
jgi:hypothetical protein